MSYVFSRTTLLQTSSLPKKVNLMKTERVKPTPVVGGVFQYKKQKVKIEVYDAESEGDMITCMVKYKTGKLKGKLAQVLVADLYFVGEAEDE